MSPNRLYWGTKLRLYRNWVFAQAGRPGRSLLTLLVLLTIWGTLFGIFLSGFRYAQLVYYLDVYLISGMFGVFLLLVSLLLVLSGAVLANAGLYARGEAALLMHLPIAPERAALYRSVELAGFNTLAALYLTTPLVAAYVIVERVAPGWIALDLALLGPLYLIPNSIGFTGAMALRRLAGSVSTRGLLFAGALLALAGFYVLLATFNFGVFDEDQHPVILVNQTAHALSGTRAWFLPTFWYVEAVFSPARGYTKMTVWFGAILVTVASACALGWAGAIRRWYYASWLAATGSDSPAEHQATVMRVNRLALWTGRLRPAPLSLRTLLAKDLLLFVRDHAVRTQGLVMVGLLLVYFASLRSVYTDLVAQPEHKLLVSTVNFAAIGILLAAFGSRFILPLVGMEGRKFWLLRTAPPSVLRLLVEKWLFGVLVMVVLGEPLLALSNFMTSMDRVFVAVSHATLLVEVVAFSAICIGVGATFPDFGEGAGSGVSATFAFALCMAGVLATLGFLAWPYVQYVVRGVIDYPHFLRALWLHLAVAGTAGAALGVVLLALGRLRLERYELP